MLKMNPIHWEALLALGWTFLGIFIGLNGGKFRDAEIPRWGGWIIGLSGGIIFFLCLRAILRGSDKVKESPVTDEDISKAKAELEKMYVKEHGVLPEYPGKNRDGKEPEQKH